MEFDCKPPVVGYSVKRGAVAGRRYPPGPSVSLIRLVQLRDATSDFDTPGGPLWATAANSASAHSNLANDDSYSQWKVDHLPFHKELTG